MNRIGWCAVAILIMASLLFLATTGTQEPQPVYINYLNLYKAYFSEPFETVLLIFKDGDIFAFTAHLEDRVGVGTTQILDYLIRKKKKKMNECLIIIHNHLLPAPFSMPDKMARSLFVDKGFIGYFLVYFPATKTIMELK